MAKYFEIIGDKAAIAKMKRIEKMYGKLFVEAVKDFADDLKPKIEEQTPIDSGAMVGTLRRGKDQGDVYLAMGGKEVEVETDYNIKKTQNYTIRQHEDLTLNHPGGGNAKFMERPFLEAIPTMEAKIAAKLKSYKEYQG